MRMKRLASAKTHPTRHDDPPCPCQSADVLEIVIIIVIIIIDDDSSSFPSSQSSHKAYLAPNLK